jgi:hypothetical protein
MDKAGTSVIAPLQAVKCEEHSSDVDPRLRISLLSFPQALVADLLMGKLASTCSTRIGYYCRHPSLAPSRVHEDDSHGHARQQVVRSARTGTD